MADIVIDHIGLTVSDYDKAKRFYEAALKPLGMTMMMEFPMETGGMAGGLGKNKPILWISGGSGAVTKPRIHFAFTATSRAEVDGFYREAMAAGGKDNGPPGIREHYHANYYAAFVIDPDGHNVEVVSHGS
jgi:catechol 2,3-dioxygenase-like lactoylglutathione lyase family enzyme